MFGFLFATITAALGVAFSAISTSTTCQPAKAHKRVIKVGYDTPIVDFVAQNISSMQARAFDGILYKLWVRTPTLLSDRAWTEAEMKLDLPRNIQGALY